ncbi:MAG: Mur ligase family protein [bacterium]|nr:Mur ligase family protein [bacterium]
MMRKIIQYILKYLSMAILAKYKPKVVVITGSVGKSSAKEAIKTVLEYSFPKKVRANEKNLNTEIGVPLTIIGGIDAKNNVILWFKNFYKALKLIFSNAKYPQMLVLEMAADKPNDIVYLTSFIYSDIAVITAIGEMPVHLEFFPERDEYISEKVNVLKSLKPNGLAILNYDDLSVRELRDRVPTGRQRIYYGFQAGAEIELSDFVYNLPTKPEEIKDSGMEFKIEDKNIGKVESFKVSKTIGLPTLYAVLAATAVGRAFDVSLKDISKALEKFSPPEHRLEILKGIKDTIIIDDSYNSSPLACEAALELLSKFKKNRKITVLGSMKELGINMEEGHRMIGKKAAKIAKILFFVGDEMLFAKEEAEKQKKKLGENLFWFKTSNEAIETVKNILQKDDVVLIKASRSVKMETIVEEVKG